jgi:hypothetical protein
MFLQLKITQKHIKRFKFVLVKQNFWGKSLKKITSQNYCSKEHKYAKALRQKKY